MLGPRPTPDKISFDARCFETRGFETHYRVCMVLSAPRNFGTDRSRAEAFAARVNRDVVAFETPISVRISWS